jgi:hypothetical protein
MLPLLLLGGETNLEKPSPRQNGLPSAKQWKQKPVNGKEEELTSK